MYYITVRNGFQVHLENKAWPLPDFITSNIRQASTEVSGYASLKIIFYT
jgi:hypothetical protein